MAKVVRTISADASVTATAIDAKDIVSRIEEIHKTSAVVTAALGRLSIAASLMGMGMKNTSDSLTLRMNGNGPTGALIAVADGLGNVKSYVVNPVVEIPLNKYGKLDVAGAVGRDGTLSVVKDMGLKEPYCGQVPIVSGEIAEDIANYYAVSEQTPTVCGLGVLVNPDLTVRAAGGFLIQLLPFAEDRVIDILEKNINDLPSVTQMLDSGVTAEEMAMKVLEGLEPNILDSFDCEYRCDCSREKVEKALISVGKTELNRMADEDENTEVCCQFCDRKYNFSSDEIRDLAQKADSSDDDEE
ncbi:MAG: Hsp33 family molecular chaperone HslO [Oscillospiraceae bacterium]|nr:Hsp33 family molecular chaperone HslO [Oscillospiraceae bacterium]MDY2847254.1 Hsp33 family molecular chaperone HslO [Oscillospiraceae bacterium]